MIDNEVMDYVNKICDGNPGAVGFFMIAGDMEPERAAAAFERMRILGITGDKLYMLWNDCCNRNASVALDVMLEKSLDDIVEHINYEQGRGIEYRPVIAEA